MAPARSTAPSLVSEHATDTRPEHAQRPALLRRFLELFVLCGFAVAQPLLDVTGRSPETFLFYRVAGLEVVVYALLIVFVPPVLLWLVATTVGMMSAPAGRITHVALAGALLTLIAVQAVKRLTDFPAALVVVLSVMAAGAALVLFARSAVVRTFVTYLTPAPLLFALLFLLASPTADLVRPPERDAAAAGGTSAGAKPPIVMIVLDEFPLTSLLNSDGEVDGRVFPNFARLAATSHWYRNGTGVSAFTQYATPAILTGRYPTKKQAATYVEQPDNLFSVLAADYRIRASETITHLCDPALCDAAEPSRSDLGLRGLFAQTWRVAKQIAKPYDASAPLSDQFAEEPAGEKKAPADATPRTEPDWTSLEANQPRRFRQFVSSLRPTDEPTMHFLHLLLPHTPWRYLPSGVTYPDKLLGGVRRAWGKHAWPLEVNRQRHLLQVAYTDRLLGDVIDRMKQQGMWDDALVVVTADHGESFIPGTSGRRLTERSDHEAQIAWVPVFIKKPGQSQGTTSDANWEQVDLLPTVADAVGIDVPFKVDGISHLSATRDRREKYFYNNPGERITFPAAPAFKRVLQGVTDTLVTASDGPDGLYRVGDRREWIGKKVQDLALLGVKKGDTPSPMTARLAPEIDFSDVDPASGSVPALVSGTLTSARGGSLVIVVNGTVAAVSEIWPEQGEPSFAGMVNDDLFKRGRNDLALYEVVGENTPELRALKVAQR